MKKQILTFGAICLFALNSFSQSLVELVKDINPNGNSNPTYLKELNGKLLFFANGGNDYQLWVSDGSGTELLKVINPTGFCDPTNFIELNGKLYFGANDGVNSSQLWVTDGTSSGTKILKLINSNGNASPVNFGKMNDSC